MCSDNLAIDQGFYFLNSSLYLSSDEELKNSKSLQSDKEKYTQMRHRIIKQLLQDLQDPIYAKAKCALEAIQEFFAEKDKKYEEHHKKNLASPGFIQAGIEKMAKSEILKALKEISNPQTGSKNAKKNDAIREKIFGRIQETSSENIKKRSQELQDHVEKRIKEKFEPKK